jgi:hypothetical protein
MPGQPTPGPMGGPPTLPQPAPGTSICSGWDYNSAGQMRKINCASSITHPQLGWNCYCFGINATMPTMCQAPQGADACRLPGTANCCHFQ